MAAAAASEAADEGDDSLQRPTLGTLPPELLSAEGQAMDLRFAFRVLGLLFSSNAAVCAKDRVLDFIRAAAAAAPWREALLKWLETVRSAREELEGEFFAFEGAREHLESMLREFNIRVPRWLSGVWAELHRVWFTDSRSRGELL